MLEDVLFLREIPVLHKNIVISDYKVFCVGAYLIYENKI